MSGGRPGLLEEKVVRQLESVFIGGSTIPDACAYVGISEATYYRWMKIGRALAAGQKRDTAHEYIPRKLENREQYLEFFKRIKKARSVMRIEAIAIIRQAAQDGNWQAAAWLLERSDPEHWRRKVVTQDGKVDVTSDGKPVGSGTIDGMAGLFQAMGQREREVMEDE